MAKAAPTDAAAEDKPLPDPTTARPGTSGTELGLRSNREKASAAFQRAQKAEQTYRAKRQAQNARTDAEAAKAHFKESVTHLKQGTASAIRVIQAVPAVIAEKRVEKQVKAEIEKRKKAEEKKQKLEEAIKKAEAEDGAAEGEAVVV